MRPWWVVYFCVVVSVALGQTPSPDAPDVVFRTGTKLIQVNVIAQDKKGQPIADLRREEFQILDNGVPQQIRLFLADSVAPKQAPALETTAPNTFTNRLAEPTGARSGYSVILFDNLVTRFGDPFVEDGTARGRLMMLQMLQSLPAGEKIALYAMGWKLQIVREFTTDRESLEQQLKAWTPHVDTADLNNCGANTAGSLMAGPAPAPGDPVIAQARAKESAECEHIDMARRLSAFDEQLRQLADHLAGVPGRKNLIWMASRFPLTGGRAVQKLMNAGVSIYPVDEGGVCRTCPPRPKQEMRALAELTGGVPFFERNDLDVAAREAIDDGHVSYTLGFYQPGDDKTAAIHQLSVKLNRPDVTLRYRTAYETEPPELPSKNPVADFVKAMNRPMDVTAIPMSATANRVQDRLDLKVSFDVSDLDLQMDAGRWKGKAEVVLRFMTADGLQAGDVLSQTVSFNLLPVTYTSMLQNGVPYRKETKIPAKAVELKVLVGNRASGKIGTLTIPLSELQPAEDKK